MEKPWLNFYENKVPRSVKPETLDGSLAINLLTAAENYGNKKAIIFLGKTLTYEELLNTAFNFAAALKYRGVKKGDRVAIMLPNIPQCIIAYYGVLMIGAVAVMVNPLYTEKELKYQLKDSESETILSLDLLWPKIHAVINQTPLKRVVLTNIGEYLPMFKKILFSLKSRKEKIVFKNRGVNLFQWKDFLSAPPQLIDLTEININDLALLQYTGGTTGLSKGVMLAHRNLMVNALQCRAWLPTLKEGGEVFLCALPFFHVYGMTAAMNLAVLSGGAMVLAPKPQDTNFLLKTIHKYRPTIFPGIQALYLSILNHPMFKKYDFSSIKICIAGGGPLNQKVQERFEKATGAKIVEGYGLSEASPVTHCNPVFGKRKVGSIGIPWPDTNAKIIDPNENGVGELAVSGPQVMQGYWNQPEETAGVLKDGWLYTGDLARMDEDGYFYIVDRKKDMIKTFGENVYPREVEEILFKHPAVKEAVVAGLPDPEGRAGEIVKAYIVLKENCWVAEKELKEFCGQELAKFKCPRFIEFRKELPKNVIGKVLRRILIEEEKNK